MSVISPPNRNKSPSVLQIRAQRCGAFHELLQELPTLLPTILTFDSIVGILSVDEKAMTNLWRAYTHNKTVILVCVSAYGLRLFLETRASFDAAIERNYFICAECQQRCR